MTTKSKTNNLGAISALKGYRVQFLYSLSRILSFKDSEAEFHPEGEFEDLDIYNHNGEVAEIIQVKNYSYTLTLSKILSNKENTFIRRALNAYKKNKKPKIILVSFGEVNDDVKNLSTKKFSQSIVKKLKNLRLNNSEIKILQDNFDYLVVDEQKIKESIVINIEKWGSFTDTKIALDLLTYWIYYAAEKQVTITPTNFKEQFDQICKFQNERVSFNKTYNSLIQSLDSNIENEDREHLKSDFYKGISATYKHILADVDVPRVEKLESIKLEFGKSNIVFIHGASGQGKSTLAYRYLNENCSGATVFELKHLPEDITVVYDVINSLEGISKGIRFPITIYIDVEPGNQEWVNILRELASKKNFNFLVTIREEDWNSIEVGDEFNFSEIELLFEQKEAELLYESLDDYNTDLKFIDFNNAWDTFGGNGPLLEFVYLITQHESLSAKLKSQINKIRNDSSVIGNEKIKLLRYIVQADCYGSKIKLKEFNQFLKLGNDILFLIDLLHKEYLIKISGDKSYIIGLHPVRSEIIKELLFDNEIYVESEFALDAISFISDNTILNFLRNAFRYGSLSPDKLLNKLKDFTPQKWQTYLLIFKGLLWKGIADYVNKNINVINKIYTDYNKGWITVVNFDFANVIDGESMMENSDIFPAEQRQYAKTINEEFSNKQEIFTYCLNWIRGIKQINLFANNKDDWDSFGLFLFWLQHLKTTAVIINFENLRFEERLSIQPIDVQAHVLYALKMYSEQSSIYSERVEKIFLQKFSEIFNVISIEQENNSINCYYLFDILDEEFDSEESDFIHAKSIKIVNLLRFAFPNKESYGTKGVGHQFSFLPDNYDSSVKEIPRNNLPLKPLVEINSTYINLYNYTTRPNNWYNYVRLIKTKRFFFVKVLNDLVLAFKEYHKQKNLETLRLYVLDYLKIKDEINKLINPLLPKNVADEWGELGESGLPQNEALKPAISYKKYKDFEETFNAYITSLDNFLWQSANVIISKIKAVNEKTEFDTDTARVSLVGNLYESYAVVNKFQNHFRRRFEKFIKANELQQIERNEFENISILCFLYRQFINSNTYLNGNVCKLALNRLKDTDLSFRKKITNGFKQLAKELGVQVKVDFSEREKRCIILANLNNSIGSFEILEFVYNKLFEIIEQPDYTSIKYLVINSKYPVFNILLLVAGKTINSKWYEFKTYNLREKRFDELEQFNLVPQDIPSDIIEKYNIESWSKGLRSFENLDKLLESTATAFQLAFHFTQLKYFTNKEVEEYNEKILRNHITKIGSLFQENLQSSLDLFVFYLDLFNADKIEFYDETEKIEFHELLVGNHRNFYPNDNLFEKGEIKLSLRTNEMEEWIPRLEKLTNSVSFIYYFLAGKIIDGQIEDS